MAGSRPEGPEPDENERGSRQHGSPTYPSRAVQRESKREGQGTRQVLATPTWCVCMYTIVLYYALFQEYYVRKTTESSYTCIQA